jgi:hypothetical protein
VTPSDISLLGVDEPWRHGKGRVERQALIWFLDSQVSEPMLLPPFASRSLLVDTDSRANHDLSLANTPQHHFGAIQLVLVDLPVPQLHLPRRRVNANTASLYSPPPPSSETTNRRSPSFCWLSKPETSGFCILVNCRHSKSCDIFHHWCSGLSQTRPPRQAPQRRKALMSWVDILQLQVPNFGTCDHIDAFQSSR